MQLNLIIDDWSMNLEIPQNYLKRMQTTFEQMDQDMDKGMQIGQNWVAHLNTTQRCQLAANHLLTALETDNEGLALMMGGYILSRMKNIKQVIIDNNGEPQATQFF
jgi:hypothetical protein